MIGFFQKSQTDRTLYMIPLPISSKVVSDIGCLIRSFSHNFSRKTKMRQIEIRRCFIIYEKMEYVPEFTIDSEILSPVSDISVLMYCVRSEFLPSNDLKLRRENRIRSIHSSLAIEGNTLSLKKVTEIIDGKKIIGNIREIQEVKNAVAAYNLFDSLDPFSVNDLLKTHKAMMLALIDDPGKFRDCGSVYSKVHYLCTSPRSQNMFRN